MEDIITTVPIQPTPLVTGPPSGKGREGNGKREERPFARAVRKQPRHNEEPGEHPAIPELSEGESDEKGGKIDLTA